MLRLRGVIETLGGGLRDRIRARYLLVVLAPIPLVYFAFGLLWASQHRLQADFTAFYTGASIVAQGLGDQVYDLELQRRVQAELIYPHRFAVGDLLSYRNPPFAVLPLLPLAALSIQQAYWVWMGANLIFFVASLVVLSTATPSLGIRRDLRSLLWVASFAFLPILAALLLGQLSFLLLLFFVSGFYCLQREWDFRAGLLLAGVALKPQLLLMVPPLLVLKGRWRAVGGLTAGTLGLMVASEGAVGTLDLSRFLETSRETASWLPLKLDLTWLGFFSAVLAPWPDTIIPATVAMDGLTLMALWWAWRGRWSPWEPVFALRLALLLLASMVAAPHLYGHDLILLIPVAFYVAGYLTRVGAKGRRVAVTKAITLAVFVAALLDSYPLWDVPVRPVFLSMLVAGWGILAAVRGAVSGDRAGSSP